jgi:glycosyltransferase involved in cell wall biosynthesis
MATICLNMIMKNEAHCVLETLESVVKHVKNLAYYVINDTGSTDGTQKLVKDFFDKHKIPGKIIEHSFFTCECHKGKYKECKWFHFGWNRTYALRQCIGVKTDWIMFIDADDLLISDVDIPQNSKFNCYNTGMITENTTNIYQRVNFIKNDDKKYDWRYRDIIHEAIESGLTMKKGDLPVTIISRRLGSRSLDPKKYFKDAEAIRWQMETEGFTPRRQFYYAQSLFDANMYDEAITAYEIAYKTKGGDFEEKYFSLYKIGHCLWKQDKDPVQAYTRAHKFCEKRFECLYFLICYLFEKQRYEEVLEYKKYLDVIKQPEGCNLFIIQSIYDYQFEDMIALSAYKAKKYLLALDIYLNMRKKRKYRPAYQATLDRNISWCIKGIRN